MKLAFLYAGQGAQHPGMGKDLYDAYPAFRAAFDAAAAAVPFDLKTLCFEGPAQQLADTRYTQPCMVAFAAGVTAVLQQAGIVPAAVAGLSLGEYSALCAAGVFTAPAATALAAFRGQAMATAVTGRACGMAAILGLGREALEAVCQTASSAGVVQIANYNCPGQLVIGGDAAAVQLACTLAKEAGAKRCLPLAVSGPFHTSLMAPAGDALRARLAGMPLQKPLIPVYFNCLGGPMRPGDTIPALLEQQVQSPVYFEDLLRRLQQDGIDTVLEIGPGRVLSGFVKKTLALPPQRSFAAETAAELAAVLAALQEGPDAATT